MASKKVSLPEVNVDSGELVDLAKELDMVRAEKAQRETREKEIKTKIADLCKAIRVKKLENDEYIGVVRVTGEEVTPVRTEFRMKNGTLSIDQESDLDELFGPSRPLLFAKETGVTEILDPAQLIADLKAKGKNPWDFLDLSVKDGMDSVVASIGTESVVSSQAFLPRQGLLTKLTEIAHTLGEQAKSFLVEYLDKALSATVVAGTRGKG